MIGFLIYNIVALAQIYTAVKLFNSWVPVVFALSVAIYLFFRQQRVSNFFKNSLSYFLIPPVVALSVSAEWDKYAYLFLFLSLIVTLLINIVIISEKQKFKLCYVDILLPFICLATLIYQPIPLFYAYAAIAVFLQSQVKFVHSKFLPSVFLWVSLIILAKFAAMYINHPISSVLYPTCISAVLFRFSWQSSLYVHIMYSFLIAEIMGKFLNLIPMISSQVALLSCSLMSVFSNKNKVLFSRIIGKARFLLLEEVDGSNKYLYKNGALIDEGFYETEYIKEVSHTDINKIAVIGVGTGKAVEAFPGKDIDFYDIDKVLYKLAKQYFPYISLRQDKVKFNLLDDIENDPQHDLIIINFEAISESEFLNSRASESVMSQFGQGAKVILISDRLPEARQYMAKMNGNIYEAIKNKMAPNDTRSKKFFAKSEKKDIKTAFGKYEAEFGKYVYRWFGAATNSQAEKNCHLVSKDKQTLSCWL